MYCTSKAALDMTAKVMAKEEAPRGVRVNVVSPGPIATDMYLDAVTNHKRDIRYRESHYPHPRSEDAFPFFEAWIRYEKPLKFQLAMLVMLPGLLHMWWMRRTNSSLEQILQLMEE